MKVNITRTGVIYFIILTFFIASGVRILDIQFIHKPNEKEAKKVTGYKVIPCTRGSILACDGRPLAFTIPEFRMYMDCCAADSAVFYNNIDSLCIKLSGFFKEHDALWYRNLIVSNRENGGKGRRHTPLSRRILSYAEVKEVSSFPILNLGKNSGGCIIEDNIRRQYPYGMLAHRTIGHITDDDRKNPSGDSIKGAGIEVSLDSLLRGQNGKQPVRLTEKEQWIEDNRRPMTPPVNGTDVLTTLDIDLQSIAENALMSQLDKSEALEGGTVIVMEVATGAIKAMVNKSKKTNSGKKSNTYTESYNYALSEIGNPGSVFKLATLTALLEEGKLSLDDIIMGEHVWHYGGRDYTDEHLANDTISIIRGFAKSSNNVFRMIAAKHYGDDPAHFIDLLRDSLKIVNNFDFDIKGLKMASVVDPRTTKGWSLSDLPTIAIGYTVQLTPLHTATFYNAIANGGVMMKPRLVDGYIKDGQMTEQFPPVVIDTVCRKSTATQLHRAMRAVVTRGTARSIFNGCKVNVSGKTGTAWVIQSKMVPDGKGGMKNKGFYRIDGKTKYQATFAGFFPSENPKYTVMAVIYSYPSASSYYGATWSAPVVREIAEKIYGSSTEWDSPLTAKGDLPPVRKTSEATGRDSLGVPSVIGMGLRDALRALEKEGYEVSVSGKGKVTQQLYIKNKKIKLILADATKKI